LHLQQQFLCNKSRQRWRRGFEKVEEVDTRHVRRYEKVGEVGTRYVTLSMDRAHALGRKTLDLRKRTAKHLCKRWLDIESLQQKLLA
jgi:hypothetical protein